MSRPTIRRPALLSAGLLALTLMWVVLRLSFGTEGISAWLFWPFLALEVYALLRVALLGLRLHRSIRHDEDLAAPAVDAESAFDESAFDIAVLVTDGHPRRTRLSLLSATQVDGARELLLVGPADEQSEQLAEEFGARRVLVEAGTRSGLVEVLAAAAVRATDAGWLAFVTSDSVLHHEVISLSRDALRDPRVAWVQSMARSAPERDVLHALENDQVGVADGANGLSSWSVNASVVRTAAFRSVLAGSSDAGLGTEGIRSDLLAAGWRGAWSTVSLAVANGAERGRHDSETAGAAARLRLFWSRRSPMWARGLSEHARVNAVASLFEDLRGFAALGLLAVVVASLVTGDLPFTLDLWAMLVAGAVVHSTNSLVRWRLTERRVGPLTTARTAFESIDPSIAAVLSVPARRVRGTDRSHVHVAFVAALALLGSLALRALSQVTGWPLNSPGRVQEMVLLTAGVVAIVPLLRAIDVIIPVALRRDSARVEGEMQVDLDGMPVQVLDMGPSGVGVRQDPTMLTSTLDRAVAANAALEIGATTSVLMRAPGGSSPMRVEGVVRSSVLLADDSRRIGIEFVEMSDRTRDALMAYWAAAWIPGAADPRAEARAPRVADALKVQVNRRSSPALRVIAAITLVATGVASLPPYGSASAATPPLPKDTLALTKEVRGVGASGAQTQGTTLYGAETSVGLTAYNTWSADDESRETYYNVSFRDVVPAGASYVPGSASVEPTTVIPDVPEPGQTTLIWQNLSDTQPGSSAELTYRMVHNTSGADDQLLIPGNSIGGQAETYANTHPRYVPSFDREGVVVEGKESYTNLATANGSTTIVPIQIQKSEPSPEAELMRGVHHPTTYTLTVSNNLITGTNKVSVDDYLPAGLEFLGCGTTDHTPDAPGTEGGVEYPGAPRLDESSPDLTADDGCAAPVLVETVTIDPDEGGPLAKGVYTHVQWAVGDLAAGETRVIRYLAAIPERANEMWPTAAVDAPEVVEGEQPPASEVSLAPPAQCAEKVDSCEQVANLANNTGPLTTATDDGQGLTNLATVTGDYTGRLTDGVESYQVWDSTTETVIAEDLAIQKSACNSAENGVGGGKCPNGVEYGNETTWTLRVRTGEYRDASDVVIVDHLPDGLEYVKGTAEIEGSGSLDPDVSGGKAGTQELTWKLPSSLKPETDLVLTFRSTTLAEYRETGLPVLVFDTLSNTVDLDGVTSVVAGDRDDEGTLAVHDDSGARLTSRWNSVSKETLFGAAAAEQSVNGEPCAIGSSNPVSVAIDGPRFSPGDLVCFDLAVDMPQKVRLRNVALTDFLPANAEYVGFTPYEDDTAGQYADPEVVPSYNNAVIWNYGTPVDSEQRYTPVEGGRFHVVIGARVSNDPKANNDFDLYQNLLKVAGVNSQGTSPVSPRASSPYLVAEPVLALTKGVVDVVRDGTPLDGYPTAGPVAGNDTHTVVQGDLVTYRIDIPNTGVQFRDPGKDPEDPKDDVAATMVCRRTNRQDELSQANQAPQQLLQLFRGDEETQVADEPTEESSSMNAGRGESPPRLSSGTKNTNTATACGADSRITDADMAQESASMLRSSSELSVEEQQQLEQSSEEQRKEKESEQGLARAEAAQVQQDSAEQKQVEQAAAERKVAKKRAAGETATRTARSSDRQKAAEERAAKKAARQKAADAKDADQETVDQKAAEKKEAAQKEAEKKAAAQKGADQKAADQKAADQKAAEEESTTASGSRTQQRLSSGMRINSAKDDAAGLAIEADKGLIQASDAVGVQVWDGLPAAVSCDSLISVDGVPAVGAEFVLRDGSLPLAVAPVPSLSDVTCDAGSNRLSLVVERIPAGYDLHLSYTSLMGEDLASGSTHTDTAGVRSYADVSGTTPYYPSDNIDRDIAPDGKIEPNSPPAIDSASVTLPDAGIAKARTTSVTETRNDTASQATIGERVLYTVAVNVPFGTSVFRMSAADPLPATLGLVKGSTKLTTPDGVDGSGFVLTEDLGANRWNLAFPESYRNTSKGDQTFLVTYEAVVLDVTANVAAATIVNEASVQWGYSEKSPADAETHSATSSTTVVEPKPTLSKSHTPNTNPSTVTGASVVTYTLKVANTKDRSPLHDVVVTDCVPAGLAEVTPTGTYAAYATVEAAGSPCASDATRIVWDLSPLLENTTTRPTTTGLQPNESLSLTYTTKVTAPAAGDGSLVNNAKVTGTSLSGKVDGERTSYNATTTDTLKVAKPTIAKTVASATLLPGTPTLYSLTVTVPQGIVTYDATIVDVLPANLAFDSYSALPTLGSTCVQSGTAPHTITRSGQNIGWFLGDLRTPDGACTIVLTYTAHAKSAAVAGNTLTNNVKLLWNLTNRQSDVTVVTGSGFDRNVTSTATVTVVEPKLTIAKAVDDGDRVVEAGQLLTYTLTVANTGTNPAYDVVVSDSFPAGLSSTGTLGGTCVGSTAGTIDATARTITWSTLFDGSTGLGVGASCTLTYTQVVDAANAGTLTDGGTLKNTAAIKEYWGDPTHTGSDYKKYTGGSAEAQVTTYLPKLGLAKFTGNGSEVADADVGSPFAWKLVISNKGKGTAYGVDVSDTLPMNWTFDPGSVEFTPSVGSNCSPSVEQLTPLVVTTPVAVGDVQRIDWSNLCDLSANSTVTITFTATPQLAATVNPGLVDADGAKVLQPNIATADGSDAGGTALAQATDDAAATLRSADVRIVKTDASADDDGDPGSAGFAVGTVGQYFLDVRNAGPDTASGPIVVTDTVPAGLTARSASGEGWECTIVGALVTCTSDGTLAVNQSLARIVVSVDVGLDALNTGDDTGLVTNTAQVTSPSPDPDTENNTDSEPTPIARVVDVSITKTLDAATPFVPGTDVAYQIVVTNNGPSPALGPVTVTDDLPDHLRLVAVSGTGWDCSATVMPVAVEDTGNVSCVRTATNLASGSAFEPIVVTASIDPSLPTSTKVTNVATVEYPGDSDPSNNSSDASSDTDARATLSIVKDDGDAVFTAGQTDGRYYVTVANTGPSVEAGPVVVTDSIEEDLQLVAVDATGWSCEVTAGTGFADGERGSFSCTWVGMGSTPATVGVDETLSVITVQVAVSPAAIRDPRPGAENLVSNEATVTGTTDTKEHSDDESTPVVPAALLTIDKTHDTEAGPWQVGSDQTYRVTVGNDGPSGEYGDVVVSDTLPEGLEFSDASGEGWDCELRTGAGRGPNGTVHCEYARGELSATTVLLAAGDALPPIDIDVVVLADAAPNAQPDPAVLTNEVANTATVAGVTDTEEHSDTDVVQVQPMADLTIDKSHEADSFQVGETGEFTIDVTNNGPNAASGPITVVDSVPVGLNYVSADGLGWTCEPDWFAGTVTCVHPDPIGVDETSTISLVVDVTPGAYDPVAPEGSEGSEVPAEDAHRVVNTVEVSGPTPETDPDNNTDSDAVDIDPLVDLMLTKTHQGDFGVTEVGTFSLEVTNGGPAALPMGPVTVVDTLPNGLEFRSATGDGWECTTDQAQVVITCTTEATLAIGAALPAIEVEVDVTPAAEGGVVNTAVVSTPIVEVTTDNNTARDEVTIVPLSNLTVTKALQGQLTLGRQSVWRVVVHNDGPSAAANPVVVDELPDVFTEVAASGDGFACDVVGRTVTCRRTSPLPADASAELVITGVVSSGGGREITNTVKVSTTTPETSTSDNSASAGGVVTEVEADSAGNSSGNSTEVGGESQSQSQSLPARLAFTGATILGILAAGAAFLVGGFMFTGFGRRRRRHTS